MTTKRISTTQNPRAWYAEHKKDSIPVDFEFIDTTAIVSGEVGCTHATADRLIEEGLVEVVDSHEIPHLIHHHATPKSCGIAYYCGEATVEDGFDSEERAVWRIKLLEGGWAKYDSNGGFPIFTEWARQPKYLSPYWSPACAMFLPAKLPDSGPIFIVEGEKKAIVATEAGHPAISIPGVANWGSSGATADKAARTGDTSRELDPHLKDAIGDRNVVIGFDSPDVFDNPNVIREAARLQVALTQAGIEASWLVLPRPPGKTKWGLDDWILSHRGQSPRQYVVDENNVQFDLSKGDDRADAILRLLYERAKVRHVQGLTRLSPMAETSQLVKRLKLPNERALLESLKEFEGGALERSLPELWEHLSTKYSYSYQGPTVFERTEIENLKVYRRLPEGPLEAEIDRWVRQELHAELRSGQIAEIASKWKLRQTPVDPATFRPCDLPTSSGNVFSVLPLPQPGLMPAWDEFLDRTDKVAFLTWLGSVLDPSNRDRRVLWLEGEGNDGKSRVVEVLANAFGVASCKLPDFIDQTNKHLTAPLEGRRLAYVADTKQAALLQTSLVRSISGGDALTIDRKGKDAYTVPNFVRLIIFGNVQPKITSARSDRSRLVYLKIKPNTRLVSNTGECLVDDTWATRLEAEIPQLFMAALKAYAEAGKQVVLSPESKELIEEAVTLGEGSLPAILERHFVLDAKEFLPSSHLSAFCDSRKMSATDQDTLRRMISKLPGVSSARKDNIRGFKGVKLTEMSF